jgi:hypothetical protein
MADVRRNIKKNGIEVSFPSKPEPEVLVWLKANKFRWGRTARVWWHMFDEDVWQTVNEYFGKTVSIVIDENAPLLNPRIERDYSKGIDPKKLETKDIPGDMTKPFTFDPDPELQNIESETEVQELEQITAKEIFEKIKPIPTEKTLNELATEESAELRNVEEMSKKIISKNRHIPWSEIPAWVKYATPVKKISFEREVADKNLLRIVTPYGGDDPLRPAFFGVNFEKGHIVTTDAHLLLHLAQDGPDVGLYCITADCLKQLGKKPGSLVEDKFPEWQAIIPWDNCPIKANVNVLKLKTYCEIIMKAKQCSDVVNTIFLRFSNDFEMTFNASYVTTICTTLLQLGHTEATIHASVAGRPIIFTTKGLSVSKKDMLKSDWMLLMPLMDERDEDILSYFFRYNINTNQVLDSFGALSDIDTSKTKDDAESLLPVSPEMLSNIEKLTKKSSIAIIQGTVLVEKGILKATNLDFGIEINGVNLADGFYRVGSKTLLPYELSELIINVNGGYIYKEPEKDEFPTLYDYRIKWEHIFTFSHGEKKKLIATKPHISDDDIRPVMESIHLYKKNDRLYITATNGQSLFISQVSPIEDNTPEGFHNLGLSDNSKILCDFLSVIPDAGSIINISADGNKPKEYAKNVKIEIGAITFYLWTPQSRCPEIIDVIPTKNYTKRLIFEKKAFKDLYTKFKKGKYGIMGDKFVFQYGDDTKELDPISAENIDKGFMEGVYIAINLPAGLSSRVEPIHEFSDGNIVVWDNPESMIKHIETEYSDKKIDAGIPLPDKSKKKIEAEIKTIESDIPSTMKETTMYYKIKTKTLSQYLSFLVELKKHIISGKVFSAGIGDEYLIITGLYDKDAAMHPSISVTDFDDIITDSKDLQSYKRLSSVPVPEKSWKGEWKTIDERIAKIEYVLKDDDITIESDQVAQEVAQEIAEEPVYYTKENAPANIQNRFGVAKEGYEDKRAGVPKRFIEDLDNGLKLYSVDGKYVRDNLYSDFSQGGNDMAFPEFVPIGECWYEEAMEEEKEHIIKHEKDERVLMAGGKLYEDAHEEVKEEEDSERGENTETMDKKVYTLPELWDIYSFKNGYNLSELDLDNIASGTHTKYASIGKLRGTYPNYEREPKHKGIIIDSDYKWFVEVSAGKYKETANPYKTGIEPEVKIISEEIITPTQTEEEVAQIPEEQWKEPVIAPKPVMSGIDTINSIDTDNYNYWFERYSAWGKSEVEEVWDKYYKEHAEDADYLNSSNNRFKALVSVAKKKGIISLILGKKEKPVSETFESFKADYLANFNALMKYSPNEVGSEIYSEKMAIMSDRHPDWVERIEEESVTKSPEIVPAPVISVTITDYNSEFRINKAIEKLLDSKWNEGPDKYSEEQLAFIKGYTGYGGLDDEAIKAGEKIDVKALFEYYTPEKVIEKMWGLAYKYGYKDGPVCEPSCGVGSFFDRRFVANTIEKHGYEINKYSAKIAKLLYPEAIINDGAEIKHFEQLFIVKNYTVRSKVTPKYSLVIGNPPYGSVGGQYMGMGESTYTHAKNYIEYFILRGLDLLIPGGLLIYIIGAETAAGGKPFLDQGMTKTKEMIMERGKLIDAYRLPSGVFSRTDVTSDIVCFKKR